MKKINLLFYCFLLFLISCSKNGGQSPKANVNMDLIEEVEQLSSQEISLGYMKLNPDEKVVFWHHHYNKFLNDPNETEKVKAHVRKIKAYTTADIYRTLNTPATQKKLADIAKEWLIDPITKSEFDADKLHDIATFIGIKKGRDKVTLSSLRTTSLNPNAAECQCYYDISCGGPGSEYCREFDICRDYGPYECGVFGTARCDGKCEWD